MDKIEESLMAKNAHKVQVMVSGEFAAFRALMCGKSAEEVFANAYEIHVKNEIDDAIQYGCLSAAAFDAMAQYGDGILDYLYERFVKDEYASVNTYADTEDFIESTMRMWREWQE